MEELLATLLLLGWKKDTHSVLPPDNICYDNPEKEPIKWIMFKESADNYGMISYKGIDMFTQRVSYAELIQKIILDI